MTGPLLHDVMTEGLKLHGSAYIVIYGKHSALWRIKWTYFVHARTHTHFTVIIHSMFPRILKCILLYCQVKIWKSLYYRNLARFFEESTCDFTQRKRISSEWLVPFMPAKCGTPDSASLLFVVMMASQEMKFRHSSWRKACRARACAVLWCYFFSSCLKLAAFHWVRCQNFLFLLLAGW
jgi:hypothetical protein